MEGHPRISELLLEVGGYSDKSDPVILADGRLGIYYVNTEMLIQDGVEWKKEKYTENSAAMIDHAVRMTQEHTSFGEVIKILTDDVRGKFTMKDHVVISGLQRRDWPFSGPVARELNLSHVSLYKDGKIEVVDPRGNVFDASRFADEGYRSIHVSDLLTGGSSAYRDDGRSGWLPSLRDIGIVCSDLFVVVDRLQGGGEMLRGHNVDTNAYVYIDEDFLGKNSNDVPRAVEYNKNSDLWSRNYLEANGALAFLGDFNPDGGRLDKAKAFIKRYSGHLGEVGKYDELAGAVHGKYDKSLTEILG